MSSKVIGKQSTLLCVCVCVWVCVSKAETEKERVCLCESVSWYKCVCLRIFQWEWVLGCEWPSLFWWSAFWQQLPVNMEKEYLSGEAASGRAGGTQFIRRHLFRCALTDTNTRTQPHKHTLIHKHTYIYKFTHAHAHTRTHKRTHTNTYSDMCTTRKFCNTSKMQFSIHF